MVELLPGEAEAEGLLALMLLHDARRPARTAEDGTLVPLEEQDRSRWDRGLIDEGAAVLDRAVARGVPGPYQLQAAIAALHVRAARPEDTDWPQIAALYGALLRHSPSPIVELNAAAAVAMARGPEAGLEWMERLDRSGTLAGYHLLPAAQADLLRRLGRAEEARVAYGRALALVRHPAEQSLSVPALGVDARRAGRSGRRSALIRIETLIASLSARRLPGAECRCLPRCKHRGAGAEPTWPSASAPSILTREHGSAPVPPREQLTQDEREVCPVLAEEQ